jgi:hypothetical protein
MTLFHQARPLPVNCVQKLREELRATFAATTASVYLHHTHPTQVHPSQPAACGDSCALLLLFLQALGDELRAKFAATKAQVLAIVRQQELLEDPKNSASPELDEKLRLRAPYVAPLNVLQVNGVTKLLYRVVLLLV